MPFISDQEYAEYQQFKGGGAAPGGAAPGGAPAQQQAAAPAQLASPWGVARAQGTGTGGGLFGGYQNAAGALQNAFSMQAQAGGVPSPDAANPQGSEAAPQQQAAAMMAEQAVPPPPTPAPGMGGFGGWGRHALGAARGMFQQASPGGAPAAPAAAPQQPRGGIFGALSRGAFGAQQASTAPQQAASDQAASAPQAAAQNAASGVVGAAGSALKKVRRFF